MPRAPGMMKWPGIAVLIVVALVVLVAAAAIATLPPPVQRYFRAVLTVADARGTPEMARGELMRFLAEATWYPTRLLPGNGMSWDAIDDSTARATLRDSVVDASLEFHFDAQGFVREVSTSARDRTVGDRLVPTPWRGRFWNYALRNGMRIPLDGEVEWVLPGGPLPYWRGHIASITSEPTR